MNIKKTIYLLFTLFCGTPLYNYAMNTALPLKKRTEKLTNQFVAEKIVAEKREKQLYIQHNPLLQKIIHNKRRHIINLIREHKTNTALYYIADLCMQPYFDKNILDLFLGSAILHDNYDLTQALVYFGANVNARDDRGVTPLYLAAYKRNIPITKFLLQRNANPYLGKQNIYTPLDAAQERNYTEIIQLLTDYQRRYISNQTNSK